MFRIKSSTSEIGQVKDRENEHGGVSVERDKAK
jgi:hypothetical protein